MAHFERVVRAIATKHKILEATIGHQDNPLYRQITLVAAEPVRDAEALAKRIQKAFERRRFRGPWGHNTPQIGEFTHDKSGVWWVDARLPYASEPDKPETGTIGGTSGQINKFIEYLVHIRPNSKHLKLFAANPENKGQRQDLPWGAPVPIVEISAEKLARAIKVGKK